MTGNGMSAAGMSRADKSRADKSRADKTGAATGGARSAHPRAVPSARPVPSARAVPSARSVESGPDPSHEFARARRAARWVGLVAPLAFTAVGAGLTAIWLPRMPDPAATHWSGTGGPDGFGPPWTFVALSLATGLGFTALFWAVLAASSRGRGGALPSWSAHHRLLAAASAGLVAMLQLSAVGSAAVQLDLPDAAQAPGIGGLLLAGLALLLGVGAGAWAVQPDVRVGPADARPGTGLDLAVGERAVWIRTVRASVSFSAIVLSATALAAGSGIWLLAAGEATGWIPLGVGVLLVALFATMAAFRVRIDAGGLAVRSALGWPAFRTPLADIAEASSGPIHPLADFGGWGIRWAPGRTGVVLRAGDGIIVTRHDGTLFAVTVDDASTGAALLTGFADRAAPAARPAAPAAPAAPAPASPASPAPAAPEKPATPGGTA
ncbi:DUF1648 domain-containing protein [Leucobacter sp. PH1c]|uniref:DUF1648 domain-containing protein n=1 Tax=Leucobacter sp. PH1c TaxID=1397278 RepID=UPI00046B05A5|nr:DUF1648 domain-containing protein [Leucobacter sp. PH1c]